MKTFLSLIFAIPFAIVINAILGIDHQWWVDMSLGSVSFMLAYTFIISVYRD